MGESGLDDLSFWSQASSPEATIQYTNFLSLSDKELVIVSPIFPVHTSRKEREIKTKPIVKRLPCSLVPRHSLYWLNGWGNENALVVGIVGMAVRKNREAKNCWGTEKESVTGDWKDGFMSKQKRE